MLNKDIALWRQRLMDISWFMRIINESIARRANSEDNCTGRFSTTAPCVVLPPASLQSWEGRFKSQALLDEKALLSCMAYVELNPIRAQVASTPEPSDYTCVQHRIIARQNKVKPTKTIESFTGTQSEEIGIPFELDEYLSLIDWTGRFLWTDKRGSIDAELPPILDRLNIASPAWESLTSSFEQHFNHWVGSEHIVQNNLQRQMLRTYSVDASTQIDFQLTPLPYFYLQARKRGLLVARDRRYLRLRLVQEGLPPDS